MSHGWRSEVLTSHLRSLRRFISNFSKFLRCVNLPLRVFSDMNIFVSLIREDFAPTENFKQYLIIAILLFCYLPRTIKWLLIHRGVTITFPEAECQNDVMLTLAWRHRAASSHHIDVNKTSLRRPLDWWVKSLLLNFRWQYLITNYSERILKYYLHKIFEI